MKHYALTGGIGSGKTTVLSMFQKLGIPTFSADEVAKQLMEQDDVLRANIVKLIGDTAYEHGKLNRAFIANQIFQNKYKLAKLNALVHPAVQKKYTIWKLVQDAPYTVYEAAIVFEHEAQDRFDAVILIVSPIETRIKRVQKRDGTSKASILARMKHQFSDEQKIPLADFVINNEILTDTEQQVAKLHRQLRTNT